MRLRCIWLARTVPFPINSGDRAYTIGLLRSLARRADINFVGIGDQNDANIARQELPEIEWTVVGAALKPAAISLLSHRPYVSARHSPSLMVATTRSVLAARRYDFVILDQYALGWAIEECMDLLFAKACPLVYLAHNYEKALAEDTVSNFRGNAIKRTLLRLNAAKIAKMERKLVCAVDVVTAITEEDATALSHLAPIRRPVVITPGMDVTQARECTITRNTPRNLVMVGSFHWIPKQLNLINFLSAADGVARASNVRLDIIGDTPVHLSKELAVKYRWIRFLGFVEQLEPLLGAYRLALNIEDTGGGFKLKILTYVAAGLPIAALSKSLTGVPCELRKCMIVREKPSVLLAAAVAAMDDVNVLRRRANEAQCCAARRFDWDRSADRLFDAMIAARTRPAS